MPPTAYISMKKLFSTVFTIILLAAAVQLHAQRFNSHVALHASIGVAPTFFKDHTRSDLPPISMEVTYRLHPRLSLGAYWGHSRSSGDRQPTAGSARYRFHHDFHVFLLRPAIHSAPWRKVEVYGGMMLGYVSSQITTNKLPGGNPLAPDGMVMPRAHQGMFLSAFVGSLYRLTPRLGLKAELGMGVSLLSVGVRYRI